MDSEWTRPIPWEMYKEMTLTWPERVETLQRLTTVAFIKYVNSLTSIQIDDLAEWIVPMLVDRLQKASGVTIDG